MTNSKACSKCKTENDQGANFCVFCGNQLHVSSTAVKSAKTGFEPRASKLSFRKLREWLKSNYVLLTGGIAFVAFIAIGNEFNFGKKIIVKAKSSSVSNNAHPQQKPKELCDRKEVIRRCNEMILNDNSRSCINLSNRFFESCGEYDQLHHYRNAAARRLSEWMIAMESANKMIELNPLGPTPHFVRAQTYSEMGDFNTAIAEYEQTLALMPGENQTPFELANLYQKVQRPCSGIPPLEQYAYLHPGSAENAETLLRVLYNNPQCGDMLGKGKAKIRMNKLDSAIFSKATVNKQIQGDFIVDTGATLVTLSKPFADRLKLNYSAWPKMLTQTANGIGVAYRGYVDSISLQGLEARHIEVAVSEEMGSTDGLLGLSFLNRFKIELDSDKGHMLLTAR